MTHSPAAAYRWWDLRAAVLLLVALLAVASRLTATNWTENLQISYIIAFLGMAAGLALGQSKFGLVRVLLFAFLYGLFAIGWQLGLTLGQGVEWSERLLSLVARLVLAGQQFVRQQPVQDPLLAIILFATLFWVMSLQAGYALTRHADVWQATLPGGLALLVIHTYDYRPEGAQFTTLLWAASIYFIMSLLLLARLNYLKRRQGWQVRRVYFSPEVDTDILQATFIATIVLVILAWAAPLTPNVLPPARDMWTIVSKPWNDVRARFGNMFTSLKASFGVVQDNYSDSLTLGRGNALDDTPVLEVEAPTQPASGIRYYWRAWTYDTYENGRWRNSFTNVQSVAPDAFDLEVPSYTAQWTGEFSFTPQVPIGLLYAPPHPTWISRPVSVTYAPDSDGKADIASLQAAVTVYAGETYRVRASLSAATVSQLRSAGENYPDWVKDHYLQTPELTERTRALALDLTAPYTNAYDKADTVTQWLRNNIDYSETVPLPPTNRDTLDWFLFELKAGFCNYYATSEVMLLRSLGIPARISVGYARGEANIPDDALNPSGLRPGEALGDLPDRLTYTVRQRDAHAWPEVYFPQYGWVEFEPTVSQAAITRPLGVASNATDGGITPTPAPTRPAEENLNQALNEPDAQAVNETGPNWTLLIWLSIPLLIVLIGFAGWRVSQRLNLPAFPVIAERSLRRVGLTPPKALQAWAHQAALAPIEKAYQEVNEALKRLAAPADPADTPTDRVAKLKRLLPEAATYASHLLAEYQIVAYSSKEGNVAVAEQAGRLIRTLSWRKMISLRLNGGEPSESLPTKYSTWRA
jgi:transglutaminase-like putative cysteine protease